MSTESFGDNLARIDLLLESGIDMDQLMVLESEHLAELADANPRFTVRLRKIIDYAMTNAMRINEARNLVLNMT